MFLYKKITQEDKMTICPKALTLAVWFLKKTFYDSFFFLQFVSLCKLITPRAGLVLGLLADYEDYKKRSTDKATDQ